MQLCSAYAVLGQHVPALRSRLEHVLRLSSTCLNSLAALIVCAFVSMCLVNFWLKMVVSLLLCTQSSFFLVSPVSFPAKAVKYFTADLHRDQSWASCCICRQFATSFQPQLGTLASVVICHCKLSCHKQGCHLLHLSLLTSQGSSLRIMPLSAGSLPFHVILNWASCLVC